MRVFLAALLVPLIACNGVVFIGTDSGGHVAFASGTVTMVRLTVVSGPGGTNVNVTLVTLLTNGFSNTLTFCNAAPSLFPQNSFVQVNFTPAQPCISTFTVR